MKVGTIFEASPIPLSKWLTAAWLLAGSANGIGSSDLGRVLHLQQKTAWFILHRIRRSMNSRRFNSPTPWLAQAGAILPDDGTSTQYAPAGATV
jgi:hypothetical protein